MSVQSTTRAAFLCAALVLHSGQAVAQASGRLTIPQSRGDASAPALPSSTLRVLHDGAWHDWWSSDSAPARWSTHQPVLARLLGWTAIAEGVDHAELTLGGDEAFRTRLIVVRLDPSRLRLALDTGLTPRMRPAWTIASAPDDAVFAVNAGQFVRALPWGWVVLDGEQFLAPGSGPLSTTITIDSAGRVAWQHGTPVARRAAGLPAWAFQSYPTLLAGGEIPLPLQAAEQGVDAGHRDARLAIGRLGDGKLVVAMTRFDGLGSALGAIPLGLTTPEMAAVMGALGSQDAVMLDGGISAQLMLRNDSGKVLSWRGLRSVPLALVALPRP